MLLRVRAASNNRVDALFVTHQRRFKRSTVKTSFEPRKTPKFARNARATGTRRASLNRLVSLTNRSVEVRLRAHVDFRRRVGEEGWSAF